MSKLLAQVTIPQESGIPADAVVNTFHFNSSTPPTPIELSTLAGRLEAFYDTIQAPGTVALAGLFSGVVNAQGMILRVYNLDDAKPRAPIATTPLVVTSISSTTGLPSEVAVCLSFQGLKVSGLPQSRRRGRIYFGPISVASLTFTSGPPSTVRPSALIINALCGAGKALADKNDTVVPGGTASLKWVVRSEVANSSVDVIDGWVDNAFDTQRRRGEKATSRQLWT